MIYATFHLTILITFKYVYRIYVYKNSMILSRTATKSKEWRGAYVILMKA